MFSAIRQAKVARFGRNGVWQRLCGGLLRYQHFVQSNFIGTEFQIFDDGERATKQTAATTMLRQASFFAGKRHFLSGSNNGGASAALDGPEKSPLYASLRRAGATAESAGGGASSMLEDTSEGDLGKGDGGAGCRGELGVVQYHMNVMGTKGPRKMVIGVPYVDLDTNHATKWNNGETMMNQCAFPFHRLFCALFLCIDVGYIGRPIQVILNGYSFRCTHFFPENIVV